MRPVFSNSFRAIEMMRKLDSVKNRSMPRMPPDTVSVAAWYSSGPMTTQIPRMPSIPGM